MTECMLVLWAKLGRLEISNFPGGSSMDSVLGLVRYPGNDGLFRAIEMSLLSTLSGQPVHLHAEGLRGTGKTTIMRSMRQILPRIRRVKGCLYNCDPDRPHCPNHRNQSTEAVAVLGDEWIAMPFLEISHSAKIGSVVGSVDLGRLVSASNPEAALLPGTIPQAHRGIIFIDEINRLAETAPELADVLLDVMGTKPGRVQIEETGLPPIELSVQVSVWAASNPDEDPGPLEEIRRQLSDRFDFAVYTDRPGEAAVVDQILRAWDVTQAATSCHPGMEAGSESKAAQVRADLERRTKGLRAVDLPEEVRHHVSDLYSRFHLESLRAVQAIVIGMRLTACLDDRTTVTREDLARVATLALRHRVDQETAKKITSHLANLGPRPEVPITAIVPQGKMPPRFPTINFGASATEQMVAPPQLPPATPHAPPEPARQKGPETSSRQSWLRRTLNSLGRNLGVAPPAQPLGAARRGNVGGSTPPRQGSLYREIAQGQTNEHRHSPQVADPMKLPPEAPPHAARPLSALGPEELVRTQEELDQP